jgi:hypothetical protein
MAKIPLFIKGGNSKSCEGCTKCCEGYLTADINGEEIGPGKPCKACVKDSGCSIYKDRPKDPCRSFECFWRASEVMPKEFKPSEVGVIVTSQQIDGIPYLVLNEAGNQVSVDVLSWFVKHAVDRQLNIEWQIGNVYHAMGSREFNMALARRAEALDTLENKEK